MSWASLFTPNYKTKNEVTSWFFLIFITAQKTSYTILNQKHLSSPHCICVLWFWVGAGVHTGCGTTCSANQCFQWRSCLFLHDEWVLVRPCRPLHWKWCHEHAHTQKKKTEEDLDENPELSLLVLFNGCHHKKRKQWCNTMVNVLSWFVWCVSNWDWGCICNL